MTFGTAWATETQEKTIKIGFTIQNKQQEKSILVGFKLIHNYTINYDLDGGTVSPDNPMSYTIESADIKLTQPTKLGYEFAGWNFDSEISLEVTIPKGSTKL